MTKQYCDICGVDLVESNMENLLGRVMDLPEMAEEEENEQEA